MENNPTNQQTNQVRKTGREDGRIKHARKKALKAMGLLPEFSGCPKELLERPLFDLIVDDLRQNPWLRKPLHKRRRFKAYGDCRKGMFQREFRVLHRFGGPESDGKITL